MPEQSCAAVIASGEGTGTGSLRRGETCDVYGNQQGVGGNLVIPL